MVRRTRTRSVLYMSNFNLSTTFNWMCYYDDSWIYFVYGKFIQVCILIMLIFVYIYDIYLWFIVIIRLVQLLAGNPAPFAIMYTLGNLVSISSTCFLFGPWAQAKKMFAMTRIVTTSIYFFFMAVCLFLAFYPGTIPVRVLWLVIAVLCQFMALSKFSCYIHIFL